MSLIIDNLKAVSAVMFAIGTVGGSWLWFDARYEHAEAAERHERADVASNAQVLYALQKQETLILRNRLNDCEAQTTRTAKENVACEQYKREYRESKSRSDIMFEQIQKGGR